MAKANKTVATKVSVESFIDKIEPEEKRDDCRAIAKMMAEVSGEKATMWGPSIIGFGTYHYQYESGRTGEICMIGFAPRKSNFALYMYGLIGVYDEEIRKMGKVKTTGGCIYINKLADIDTKVLKDLMKKSVKHQLAKKK